MPDLTIRERILAGFFTRLGDRLKPAGDGGAAVALRRNPGDPQTQGLAVDLFDGGHRKDVESDTQRAMFVLSVELELFAAAGPELNELYGRVMDAAEIDRTFGDLAIDTLERDFSAPSPGTVEGHPDIVGSVLTLEIHFWTRDADVRALAP